MLRLDIRISTIPRSAVRLKTITLVASALMLATGTTCAAPGARSARSSSPPGLVSSDTRAAPRFEAIDFRRGRWFKGNTHTHTLESDGDSPPELVARWYKTHGRSEERRVGKEW